MPYTPNRRRTHPFFLLAFVPALVHAQAGTLDATFGTGGISATSIGSGNATCTKVLVAPDGALFAAGSLYNGANTDFALVKYHADGTVDTGFGTNGLATTGIGASNDNCYTAALQSDGKVVLGGDYANANGGYNFGVVRFLADGTLDAGFGTGGIATVDMGTSDNYGTAIAVQPDGKVLLAGRHNNGGNVDYIVLRFNANGTVDNGFGDAGIRVQPVGPGTDNCYDLALQPDGKIILAGDIIADAYWDVALVRLTSAGQPDATFGTNGIAIQALSAQDDYAYAVRLDPDGRIVVAGQGVGVQGNLDRMIARFQSNGGLDNGFGTNGVTFSDFGSIEAGFALARAGDGSYYVSASSSINGFELSHYTASGDLDTGFGTNGRATTLIGSGFGNVNTCVAVDAQQRVIVGGHAPNPIDAGFVLLRYLTGPPAGIAEAALSALHLTLAPDPVTSASVVRFTLEEESTVSFTVYDVQGRVAAAPSGLHTFAPGPHTEALDAFSGLAAGRYTLVLTTGDGHVSLPFVKAE